MNQAKNKIKALKRLDGSILNNRAQNDYGLNLFLKNKIIAEKNNLRHHVKSEKDYSQDIKNYLNAKILAELYNSKNEKKQISDKVHSFIKSDNTIKRKAVRKLHGLHDFTCFLLCITFEASLLFFDVLFEATKPLSFSEFFEEVREVYANRTWQGWVLLASLIVLIALIMILPKVLAHFAFAKYEQQRETISMVDDILNQKTKNHEIENDKENNKKLENIKNILKKYCKLITGQEIENDELVSKMPDKISKVDLSKKDPFEILSMIDNMLWNPNLSEKKIAEDSANLMSVNSEKSDVKLNISSNSQYNEIVDELYVKDDQPKGLLRFFGFHKYSLCVSS